jgi:hypothetical protein
MLLIITVLLFCFALLILSVSHSYRRLTLLEPFLGLSLTTGKWRTSPEFQQWLAFHTELCHFWDVVIKKALQAEQGEQTETIDASGTVTRLMTPPPDQAQFIQNLSKTKNEDRPFITCKDLTAESSEQDILSVLPATVQPYKDTLTFVNEQVAIINTNLNNALTGVPPPAESFANYTCTAPDGSTVDVSSEDITALQKDAKDQKTRAQLGQEIMDRIKPLVILFPSMKQSLEKARAGVADLEKNEADAKSGAIYARVDIPPKPQ